MKRSLGIMAILAGIVLAGCSSPNGGPPEPATQTPSLTMPPALNESAPPEPIEHRVDSRQCTVQVRSFPFATGQVTTGDRCDFTQAGQDLTQYRAARVVVEWATLQPTIMDLKASVQSAQCTTFGGDCEIASASGLQTGLLVEVPPDIYLEHADEDLHVRLLVEGVAVDQPFMIRVSLSTDGVFLPGEGE